MRLSKKLWVAISTLVMVCSTLVLAAQISRPAFAQEPGPPQGPSRIVQLTVDYTSYEWWVIRWSDNNVDCSLFIDREGLPTGSDILGQCGRKVFEHWSETPACYYAGSAQAGLCDGVYLYQASALPAKRQVDVVIPPPKIWVSLYGCTPQPPQNTCSEMPYLVLTGEDPLPNEAVIRINGMYGDMPFSCPGNQCAIPLQETGIQGLNLEFWADSSFGDSSDRFTAMLRVVPWGDFANPEVYNGDPQQWFVDVISSQWRGDRPASCAETWQVFPELGGPRPWLTTPDDAYGLASSLSYYLLAGMLIRNGMVDVSVCPDGGMASDYSASECGLAQAQTLVMDWQNRFDAEILTVSRDTGVPAQLMKNIFSRESQFWPGMYWDYKEAGLGQLTEKGADTVLLWNPAFFEQFCPLVLSRDVCQYGFGNLNDNQRNLLRGALVGKVNAACPECPVGIDLTRANFSVRVFAESLLANCEQVAQIFYNITSKPAGQSSSYEDLWRFSLVNYNGGPGCLGTAVQRTADFGQPLDWFNVIANLDPVCMASIDYVNDISQAPQLPPTPTSWVYPVTEMPTEEISTDIPQAPTFVFPSPTVNFGQPTETRQPGPTRTPIQTITPPPFQTPTATETGDAYPPPETDVPYPYP